MKLFTTSLIAALTASTTSFAQSNIDANHKYSWNENTGWINWRNAGSPAATQGVRIGTSYLSGYAWGENLGWVCFGDGTPVGGGSYANTTGADYGVNIVAGGDLAGYAWSENAGWINFNMSALGAQRARIDAAATRLRGWAWGENVGWINLDDAGAYIGIAAACYANCDASTNAPILNVNDFSCFLNKFAAGDPYANCDASTLAPVLNVNDFSCFLNKYATGCP